MPTLRWLGERSRDVGAVDRDRSAGRLLEAGDHAQRRGLAAAGRAEERHELAALGGQVEVEDGRHVAKPLLDAGQFQEGHGLLVLLAGAGDGDAAPRAASEQAIRPIAIQVRPKLISGHGGRLVGACWRRAATGRGRRPGEPGRLAMVNSPMTMARVRKAPLSSATRRLGRMTCEQDPDPAGAEALRPPRSGSARRSRAGPCRPRGTCTGSDSDDVAGDQQGVAADVGVGERQRRMAVRADQPEHEDDRRDDERQQRDELDRTAVRAAPAAGPRRRSAR